MNSVVFALVLPTPESVWLCVTNLLLPPTLLLALLNNGRLDSHLAMCFGVPSLVTFQI